MNFDNDNMEPVTDLGLALGYSGQFMQRRLTIESGAGVNASLSINVPFVASSPLSELVWSPHKGLGLKCAERSIMDRRPSILWGEGPSNATKSNTASRASNDKPMDENLLTPKATKLVTAEVTEGYCKSPRSEAGITPVCESSHEHGRASGDYVGRKDTVDAPLPLLHPNQEYHLRESEGNDLCGPVDAQTYEISITKEEDFSSLPVNEAASHATCHGIVGFAAGQVNEGAADVLSNKSDGVNANIVPVDQTLGMEIVLASEFHPMNECEASNFPAADLTSPRKRRAEKAFIVVEENKNKMKKTDHLSAPTVDKLESIDENDCGAAISKVVPSAFIREVQNDLHKDEEVRPTGMIVSVKHSPTNSKVDRYRRKGKEKVFSDGDVHGRMSEDEESSHGSVESCNSAGLFPTSKKRWSFEQLLLQSKRAKKDIQDSPCSASLARKDSSFVNWISNMVKGFGKSVEDMEPPADLALAQPHQRHEHTHQKLIVHDKTQDNDSINMGFQSIFKSLYGSNTVANDSRPSTTNYQKEGSNDIVLATKICDIDVTPIAYHGESGIISKQFMLANDQLNESLSKTEVGPSTKPCTLPGNSDSFQENCKTSSAENKHPYALILGKENEGMSSKSSHGQRKANSCAENNDSDLPSEGKTSHILSNRSDRLGSLWVTRFSSKTPGPLSHQDQCNQGTICMKLDSHHHNNTGVSDDYKTLEARNHSSEEPQTVTGRELQNAMYAEVSTGLNRMTGHNDENVCQLNSIKPSQRVKSSEDMASVFARRLDALKHIIPSGVTDTVARSATTCFFCGMKGHHLRECPEITETEIEDLLSNINLHGGAEESSVFCIRCFQPNHWAVACQNASRGSRQLESPASLAMHGSTSKSSLELLGGRESGPQAVGAYTVFYGNDRTMESEPDLKHRLNEIVPSNKMVSDSTVFSRYIASCSAKNESREQISPLSIINRQSSDIPRTTFDAIKRLRLSRTDILKWMNSQTPLSRLNGFFLRLRLGKWEEGLGGTGYYVACIDGSEFESSSPNPRNAIPVNFRSIKCLVESQYISNHDFREDELITWWCAELRNGNKIPSEEYLKVKFEEKRTLTLGF